MLESHSVILLALLDMIIGQDVMRQLHVDLGQVDQGVHHAQVGRLVQVEKSGLVVDRVVLAHQEPLEFVVLAHLEVHLAQIGVERVRALYELTHLGVRIQDGVLLGVYAGRARLQVLIREKEPVAVEGRINAACIIGIVADQAARGNVKMRIETVCSSSNSSSSSRSWQS